MKAEIDQEGHSVLGIRPACVLGPGPQDRDPLLPPPGPSGTVSDVWMLGVKCVWFPGQGEFWPMAAKC